MLSRFIACVISLAFLSSVALGQSAKEKGRVSFKASGDQAGIPKRYQLEDREFDYELAHVKDYPLSGYSVYHLRFPSPVVTAHAENNTVFAEYYRPKEKTGFPCVIVLDITGGDQSLSRTICAHLAQNGIGGLFVQMAYYGPRRPPGSKLRLLSYDIFHTSNAVRQTVLDLRCATAWMASRPEIDGKRLGIMGTSLGGFMAALGAEMEPRLGRVAVLLAGGGFVDAFWDDPRAATYRKTFERFGGTKELAKAIFAPLDPLTCAGNLKGRKVLMFSAKKDEIIPPRMAEALWEATGRQKIIWVNAGHYTAALYFGSAMKHIVDHFGQDCATASSPSQP